MIFHSLQILQASLMASCGKLRLFGSSPRKRLRALCPVAMATAENHEGKADSWEMFIWTSHEKCTKQGIADNDAMNQTHFALNMLNDRLCQGWEMD